MRRSLVTILCACMLVFLVSNRLARAEDSAFKISDYIPERFEDFIWTANGGLSLSGQDYDRSISGPEYSGNSLSKDEDGGTDWSSEFSTNLCYRHETVPQFFRADFGLGAGFTYESYRNLTDDIDFDYASEYRSETEGTEKTFTTSLSPSVVWGKYFLDDFFATIESSCSFWYSERPGDKTDTRIYQLRDDGTYVRQKWTDRSSETSFDARNCRYSVAMSPGWGRLYAGFYASQAMYMIDELRSNGVLLREPTRDEMLALSDIIHQRMNKHDIDERLARIADFERIFNFLKEAGITEAKDHYGQLLIQDVWDYFPRAARRFGFRISAGPGYDYSHYRYRSTSDTYTDGLYTRYHVDSTSVIDTLSAPDMYEYKFRNLVREAHNVYVEGRAVYAKPLSRRWQMDFLARGRYYLYSRTREIDDRSRITVYPDDTDAHTSESFKESDIDKKFGFDLSSYAMYIHNSRTWLTLSAHYTYDKLKAADDTDFIGGDQKESSDHRLGIYGDIIYRISIPTSLTVGARYYYRDTDNVSTADAVSESSWGNYSLSVSLAHYLY